MTAMKCQLCSSNAFTKVDEFYQCDFCRTKYTQAQARELIGTVKIDRRDDIQQLLTLADKSLESKNAQEAYAYANRVLEIDSAHSRAWFMKGAAAGWGATIAEMPLKSQEMRQAIKIGAEGLTDSSLEEYNAEAAATLREILSAMYDVSLDNARNFEAAWSDHLAVSEACIKSASFAYDLDGDVSALKLAVKIASENIKGQEYPGVLDNTRLVGVTSQYEYLLQRKIRRWNELIRKAEPFYSSVPPRARPELRQSVPDKKEGCFVVTATFGNEDAAPVLLLKAFRDDVLKRTQAGHSFIDWYYHHAPRAAALIASSRLLRIAMLVLVVTPACLAALPLLGIFRATACRKQLYAHESAEI